MSLLSPIVSFLGNVAKVLIAPLLAYRLGSKSKENKQLKKHSERVSKAKKIRQGVRKNALSKKEIKSGLSAKRDARGRFTK